MAGFPVTLFLTLAGVTLLFSIAETNGTLDCLARRAIQLARGRGQTGVRPGSDQGQTPEPLLPHQQLTLVVIAAWIIGALTLNLSLGLSAFAGSAILLVARAADDGAAVRGMPWGIIMMVCGVSVLIGVLEKTGGMELFTSLLARLASPSSINGVIAFVTGAISTYSSTSGVVMPAFLPTIPSLVAGSAAEIRWRLPSRSMSDPRSSTSRRCRPSVPWPSPPSAISSSRGNCSVNS